jgi:hypothetical protein
MEAGNEDEEDEEDEDPIPRAKHLSQLRMNIQGVSKK